MEYQQELGVGSAPTEVEKLIPNLHNNDQYMVHGSAAILISWNKAKNESSRLPKGSLAPQQQQQGIVENERREMRGSRKRVCQTPATDVLHPTRRS